MKSTTMKNTFLLVVALCLAMVASASNGYTIYPVPQRQEAGSGGHASRAELLLLPSQASTR